MAAGILGSSVLCILLILLSAKSRKRHLTWHTEQRTGSVGFLSGTCAELVGREPMALGREAAGSRGETSSGSARQAGKQPRAEKENHPPPSCCRGMPQGVKNGSYFGLLCATREQADFC